MSGLGFGGHGGGRAVGVGGASNDTAMDDQHKLAKHQQLLEELVFQLEEAEDGAGYHVGNESQLSLELMQEFELNISILEDGIDVLTEQINILKATQKLPGLSKG